MAQNTALRIVRDQIERFRTGEITSTQMWDDITKDLAELSKEDGGEDRTLETRCLVLTTG